MKYFIIILCSLISACSGSVFERVLFEKTLTDGSRIKGISSQNLPNSNDVIWIIRQTKTSSCYITGRLDVGYVDKTFEITEVDNSEIRVRVTDTQNLKGMFVDFLVSFKDTFCFNNDCEKYPVKCN